MMENNWKLKVLYLGVLTSTAPAQVYSPGAGKQAEILYMYSTALGASNKDTGLLLSQSGATAVTFHLHDVSHNNPLDHSFFPGAGIPLSGTDAIQAYCEATGSNSLLLVGRESIL